MSLWTAILTVYIIQDFENNISQLKLLSQDVSQD